MLHLAEIASFAVDPVRNTPVIVLKESSGKRTIALPIGPIEASAIAIHSLDVHSDKPLTIDLTKLIMENLGGELLKAVIHDFEHQLFCSRIHIATEINVLVIDCRPSDALALALRCGAPIFIDERVFEKTRPKDQLTEQEKLRQYVASIDTVEFGRYFLE